MEHLTYQCNHCANTEQLSLSLNDWGELGFICEHCRGEQGGREQMLNPDSATIANRLADQTVDIPSSESDYDLQYRHFESVQNALCDWLDEMEDEGYLSASEHDALEASIYDAQPW